VLEPIWRTKTETAGRVRGRIEQVLDWAKAKKHRDGENPARWRGHLDKLLPRPSKISKVKHHEAVPWPDAPGVVAGIAAAAGAGARALLFQVLTAARSGEVRGATWAELDLEAGVWTVPPERMKGKKEHRVPLSRQVVALLKVCPRFSDCALVFASLRMTRLSDMTLTSVMRRMKLEAVPHGFRSTFRDWAAEATHFPGDLVEMALAHAIESKVEAAYRRGDMLAKRLALMQEWADYCLPPPWAPAQLV
jgi:integrase